MNRNVRDAVNVATHIAAGDDRTRYDGVAISLHWLTVFLVLANFVLGQTWGAFAKPTRHLMVATHMSFGILLAIVVVARVVWRLTPGHHVSPARSGAAGLAAKGVHYLLYGLLALEAVLGFVLRWSGGEAMSFFGLAIPSPMATVSPATNDMIGDLHNWNGWAIIILAAGHAGAALYNHVVIKNDVLRRMLPQVARRRA
jgi:cytochrome b561